MKRNKGASLFFMASGVSDIMFRGHPLNMGWQAWQQSQCVKDGKADI